MSALRNQVAVIVGAGSGIGSAIALGLAAQGANLCLVGRRLESLRAIADAAKGQAARACCYEIDLAMDDQVDALASRVLRDVDGVDILVHSAGVNLLSPVELAANSDLDQHYKVNFKAPFVVTRGLLPSLRARHGQVLFVNSTAGLSAKSNVSQYAAMKHALKGFADSLREEVNRDGVRVLTLFLGRTATPGQETVHAMEGRPYRPELLIQPEDIADIAVHALSLPSRVEVTEIRVRPQIKSY